MARMRYVKPTFWTDSRMVRLSRDARLFYIGTWNFALCDKGHLEDDPVSLKMQIFPADNIDVPALMEELIAAGRLVRVTDGEETWLQIATLEAHQKVDTRWKPRCPACKTSENLSETQESFGGATTSAYAAIGARTDVDDLNLSDALPNSPQEGRGGEGREEPPKPPKGGSSETHGRRSSSYDYDSDGDFAQFWEVYPRKTAKAHAFKAWKAARKRGVEAYIIIDAAKRYRDSPARKPNFTAHPASWLNGERYNDFDEVTSPPSSGGWWDN